MTQAAEQRGREGFSKIGFDQSYIHAQEEKEKDEEEKRKRNQKTTSALYESHFQTRIHFN